MFDGLITCASLEDLAGRTAYRRGEEYASAGTVGRLRVTDEKITAKVEAPNPIRSNCGMTREIWPMTARAHGRPTAIFASIV